MRDAAILDILDEVRNEEALPTPPLPLMTRLIRLAMKMAVGQRLRGSAMRGPRMPERSVCASDGGESGRGIFWC
jgi:hypothetical protein